MAHDRQTPYDPAWPDLYQVEAGQLEVILAPWLTGGVHHIGSTSIPGITAKPILDMMAGVACLVVAEDAVAVLVEHGWQHGVHRPDALWFFKPQGSTVATRTHHLHLTEVGSDLWMERLTFRDALRGDQSLRDEYQALKQTLDEDQLEVPSGRNGKDDFVRRVLAQSGVVLRDWRGGH